jgi:hypothetical protein
MYVRSRFVCVMFTPGQHDERTIQHDRKYLSSPGGPVVSSHTV